jgi:hypothetical protein
MRSDDAVEGDEEEDDFNDNEDETPPELKSLLHRMPRRNGSASPHSSPSNEGASRPLHPSPTAMLPPLTVPFPLQLMKGLSSSSADFAFI